MDFRVTIILSLILNQVTGNVQVLDQYLAEPLNASNYCPTIKGCQPGTHLLCNDMPTGKLTDTYSHGCDSTSGAVSLDKDLAKHILNLINAIRSQIAQGKETGGGNKTFPRAYGVKGIEWDPELATIAKVAAHKCQLHNVACTATSKFPNAYMAAGIKRHSFPGWSDPEPAIQKEVNISTALRETIKLIISVWYRYKLVYDGSKNATNLILKYDTKVKNFYLLMVSRYLTHIGCAANNYVEVHVGYPNPPITSNTILLICNFSAKPVNGAPVYNTHPDIYTKCGCDENYEEDPDTCLCWRKKNYNIQKKNRKEDSKEISDCDSTDCVPNIVYLPIISFESQSSPKPPAIRKFDTSQQKKRPEINLRGYAERAKIDDKPYRERLAPVKTKTVIPNYFSNAMFRRKSLRTKKPISHVDYTTEKNKVMMRPMKKKTSVFAKTPIFKLPSHQNQEAYSNTSQLLQYRDLHRDDRFDMPINSYKRKNYDFLPTHTDKYEVSKNKQFDVIENEHKRREISQRYKNTRKYGTEKNIKQIDIIENDQIDTYQQNKEVPYSTEKKVIHLLDSLEFEIKKNKLNKNVREIFQYKMQHLFDNLFHDNDFENRQTEGKKQKNYIPNERDSQYSEYKYLVRNKEEFERNAGSHNQRRLFLQTVTDEATYKHKSPQNDADVLIELPSMASNKRKYITNKLDVLEKRLNNLKQGPPKPIQIPNRRVLRPVMKSPIKTSQSSKSSQMFLPGSARTLHRY